MPGGPCWVAASTALLRRVILESDPQQVLQRLSLRVSAATPSHNLPHLPLPLPPPLPLSLTRPQSQHRTASSSSTTWQAAQSTGTQGTLVAANRQHQGGANPPVPKLSANKGEGSQFLLSPRQNQPQIKFSSVVWC